MLGALLVLVCLPATALAGEPAGVEHLHYAAGPYHITPGANLILFDYKHVPKPNVDGFMIRMQPNLRYASAGRQVLRQGPAHERRSTSTTAFG